MKRMKKFLMGLLACICIGAGATGFTACGGGVTVNPNSQGGVTITPTVPSSSIEQESNSSSEEQSSQSSSSEVSEESSSYSSSEEQQSSESASEESSFEESSSEESSVDSSSEEESSSEEAHVHAWTSETVVVEVSCTVSGVKILACECGENKIETTPALGHALIRCDAKAATCTEIGWNTYDKCNRQGCGYTTYEEIAPLTHDNVEYPAKEATCTEFGWDAYTVCNRCHASTYEQIPAKGHTYEQGECSCGAVEPGHEHIWNDGVVTKEAKCTETGVKTFTCTVSDCGETKTEEITALGHNNTEYAAKAPGCETVGWNAYTVCGRCSYSTYAELPAVGHSFGAGVVTKAATCTEAGVMTFTCLCKETYTQPIALLGHEYGEWFVFEEATCEERGEERRICEHDSTHIEKRDIKKLGHSYGDWNRVTEPTCAKEGLEKRVCANDPMHEQSRAVPKTNNHKVASDGVCTVCKETIKGKLPKPEVYKKDDRTVYWNPVSGAAEYQVLVNGNSIMTESTEQNLEEYFPGNQTLDIQVRACATADSDYIDSDWSDEYLYEIFGETVVNVKGLGDAVNLLTGGYTEFAGGTTSIFDEKLFGRLRATQIDHVKGAVTTATYTEGLESYLNQITEKTSTKTNTTVSAGLGKIAKVTAGFGFEVSKDYSTKSYGETKAVFYDMDYVWTETALELESYKNLEKYQAMLSEEFLADAAKVGKGDMTPERFIVKYGTHVMMAAYYGATFNAHYELLTDKKTAESAFGSDTGVGITAQIKGALKGVELELNNVTEENAKEAYFTSTTTETMRTKFVAKTKGGPAVGISALSLADFATACTDWVNKLNEDKDENNYVIIDVPDNSLFCVWDFLDDSYAEAKDVLNQYFYATCDESYYALKDKISSLYSDSILFDEERGILTVNFAGLQGYGADVDLNGKISYPAENYLNTGVKFENNVLTVYASVNGNEVKKVVFKGSYCQRDLANQLITSKFENLSIVFDKWWNRPIVMEFDSFGFTAPNGKVGLDLSDLETADITINVVGGAYIEGGDGTSSGEAGFAGILATGRNLTITGDGELTVVGGNGVDGAAGAANAQVGGNGGNGGDGIVVANLTVTSTGVHTIKAGTGGNGGTGGVQTAVPAKQGMVTWSSDRPATGFTGYTGGNGGNGGNSGRCLIVTNLTIKDSATVCLNESNSGAGGTGSKGGRGGAGGDTDWWGPGEVPGGDGGTGGTGGNGGNAGMILNARLVSGNETVDSNAEIIVITCKAQGGAGVAGAGGDGGDAGINTAYKIWGISGSTGAPGIAGASRVHE